MKYAELTPEEKLYDAIFGERVWTEGVHHWLSDAGKKAINDLLDEFVLSGGEKARGAKARGAKVIRLRFGFEPRTAAEKNKPHLSDCRSLAEVGPYLNVTRERIRQIEAKTLRRLRHPSRSGKLKPFLTDRVP